MSENVFIKKRKRGRAGALITTRHIIVLLVLGVTVYGGFRFWIGNPYQAVCGDDCGSMHSLLAWVLGFAMIFAGIIAVAAVVGILAGLMRRGRHSAFTDRLDTLQKQEKADKADKQA